jgi:excisionase family DNA binding protein
MSNDKGVHYKMNKPKRGIIVSGFLSIKDAAKTLGTPEEHIRVACHRDKIPHYKVENKHGNIRGLVFKKEELEQYLKIKSEYENAVNTLFVCKGVICEAPGDGE